jgi:hypothetical protein
MGKLNHKISILAVILLIAAMLVVATACPDNTQDKWTGTWQSEQWGEMKLEQSGNTVTGNYTWDDGKINGKVSGNILTGTWSEAPSYKPDADAGDFEFTMFADGKGFTGQWRYGSSGDWDGTWTAERVR